jgi:hypothetical protein
MKRINATSLRRKSGQWGTQRSLLVQETLSSLSQLAPRVALTSAVVIGDGKS